MYDHDPRSRRAAVRPALAAISTPRLTAAPPFSVIPCALNGVSHPRRAPKFMLGRVDNRHLYHNSTLALDADTDESRWHYQHLNGRQGSADVQRRA